VIYGKDHTENSSIYARADVSKLDIYYCQSVLDIGVSLKNTLAYMNTIDKKDTKFIDIVSRESESKANVRIIFGTTMGALEAHKINLKLDHEKMTPEKEKEFLDLNNYKINFKFPPKYFKKKMNDISLCKANTVEFIQDGKGRPLTISYESENKCGSSKIPFKDNDKISFNSRLDDDETFRITASLEDLKSISTAGFTNDVEIYMDENKSILFKTKLDDVFEMRILTKTVCDSTH
jgi:hypothetical protein